MNFQVNMDGKTSARISAQRGRGIVIALATVLALSGCALIGKKEAPRETYELTAPDNFSGIRGSTRAQILVKLPTALKSIDSDRIIVKPSPQVITYLAGAQWSDVAPRMLQSKLVEAFENTRATGATAKPGDGLVIDYQLVSDIRKFEVSNGVATIEMSIKLLADKSGLVRETRIFTATSTARGKDGAAYVAAFDSAFAELSRSIIRWVVAQV